jgi:hypothetical protein
MRTRTSFLFLAAALAGTAPASAGELFRAGAISCVSLSQSVTALSVDHCNGGVDAKRGAMFGSCNGSYTANRVKVPFTISGLMRERAATLADNDARLAFDYRGLRCSVETWRLKSVHDCRYFGRGDGMRCSVCLQLGGKRCYDAWVAVDVRHAQAAAR